MSRKVGEILHPWIEVKVRYLVCLDGIEEAMNRELGQHDDPPTRYKCISHHSVSIHVADRQHHQRRLQHPCTAPFIITITSNPTFKVLSDISDGERNCIT